jgi:CubicO group peptidase (beta-lactamase class C family)
MRNPARVLLVSVITCVALGCSTSPIPRKIVTQPPPEYWPTDGWRTSVPEQQGMDSELLADAVDFIRKENFKVHSMMVTRNGYIVADTYFHPFSPGSTHDMASCTKSFSSTLIGIAMRKSYIKDVNQPVLDFFSERAVSNVDERKKAMTLEHVLTMTSGLDCHAEPNEITLFQMMASPDWVQFMLNLPMRDKPGTRFEYCSGGSHLLSAIIHETTGMSELVFAQLHLFGPLGISDVAWPYDSQGVNNHGWGDLHMTPHNMAKLGYLYLNNGMWDGQQLLPPDWVATATSRHVPLRLRSFFDGYGYQWWTDTSGFYGARGRGGQRIIVVPDKNMVVVFTGGDGSERAERKRAKLLKSYIIQSARSEEPLPANPRSVSLLEFRTNQASQAPIEQRKPARILPKTAETISGKTYKLDTNQFGLLSCSLVFEVQDEALFRLSLNPAITGMEKLELPVGLDNVLRVSPGGRFGLPVAMKGFWETDNTFVINFDEIGNINNFRISMTFKEDAVNVRMEEMTGLGGAEFGGRVQQQ